MSTVCISNCINDARDPREPVRPVRATYVSLYRWPESDAEFVRSVGRCGGVPSRRVVDTISCRQMYLRSYTFSRDDEEEDEDKRKTSRKKKRKKEMTPTTPQECFGRVKETASSFRWRKEEEGDINIIIDSANKRRRNKKKKKKKKKKRFACSALLRFFQRLLICAATVDVVDPK